MTADRPPNTPATHRPDDSGAGRVALTDEQDVPVDAGRLIATAERALDALRVRPDAAMSVILVDRARIADLKHDAFGERAVTDVLSFPIDDPSDPMPGPVVLGDVVLCPAVAVRQARALGRAPEDELDHLLVHGILHLLGWDHGDRASEHAMAGVERRVLGAIGASA